MFLFFTLVILSVLFFFFFFFFKQKTAYEMRISDWSSDVCSSDLHEMHRAAMPLNPGLDRPFVRMQSRKHRQQRRVDINQPPTIPGYELGRQNPHETSPQHVVGFVCIDYPGQGEIAKNGSTSSPERVCP